MYSKHDLGQSIVALTAITCAIAIVMLIQGFAQSSQSNVSRAVASIARNQ
jgi:hypothetical protein